jgi:hypothetical protein
MAVGGLTTAEIAKKEKISTQATYYHLSRMRIRTGPNRSHEMEFPDPPPACYPRTKAEGAKCVHYHQCYLGFLGLCDVAYVKPKPGLDTRVVESIRGYR